ncbi:MAG: hypothetical protein NT135_00895, partial [Candidatus Berkelbacteria bacterium]|nr:hypothetical protein [Candidatus Berkelbacteria bacterium]
LEEFSAQRFNLKTPINFVVKIANLGNVHFKPQGEITVKNWRGKIVEKVALNQQKGNILPDSTRKFEEKWQTNKLKIGRFSANLHIVYGESEKTLDGKLIFWIIPWWIFLILAVFVVLIVVLIIFLKKRKARCLGQAPPKKIVRIQ